MKSYNSGYKYYYNKDNFINYSKSGNGELAIIFLAGFGQSSFSWGNVRSILKLDGDTYTEYCIDLPGFGFSSKNSGPYYSISKMSEILVAFLKNEDIKSLIMIGHSFGGLLALSILRWLNMNNLCIKCSGLIIFDIPAYLGAQPKFITSLRNRFFNFIGSIFYNPVITAKQTIRNTFFNAEFGMSKYIRQYIFFYSLPGYYNAMSMVANQTDEEEFMGISDYYSRINIPVLIIWGKEDKMIPVKFADRLHGDIKDSQLIVFDRCGHIPPEEKAEESASVIKNYLKKISA